MGENMIVGYQWGDDGAYIGSYSFPSNKGQGGSHMPPRTTLVPPLGAPVDEEPYWDGAQWLLRRVTMSYLPDRVVENGN